ncbi:helix-turn-helix domain-containing protein [Nocardioides sp. 31GB23]|uniref:helix-turn-helix domain-containing protein n=1 Tax=Nocardioides sp. 31GB23 TaxID=3156065 RepID=UPI0032AFF275
MTNSNEAQRARETMSVPEAGAVLGIGRAAAYRAAQQGELPTIRIGRRLLVPHSALRQLLGGPTDTGAAL